MTTEPTDTFIEDTVAACEETLVLYKVEIEHRQRRIRSMREHIAQLIESGISSGDGILDLVYLLRLDPLDEKHLVENLRAFGQAILSVPGELVVFESMVQHDDCGILGRHMNPLSIGESSEFFVGLLANAQSFPFLYQPSESKDLLDKNLIRVLCKHLEPEPLYLTINLLGHGFRQQATCLPAFPTDGEREPTVFSTGYNTAWKCWIGNTSVKQLLNRASILSVPAYQNLVSKIRALLAQESIELGDTDPLAKALGLDQKPVEHAAT